MPVAVALPGTENFDDEQVDRRRAAIAAARPRRVALGLALILAASIGTTAYAWDSARPGQGSFDLATFGHLSRLPLASLVVAIVACAAAVVGTRLVVDRDAAHLSRGWIGGVLVVSILAGVTVGSALLLPAKWSRTDHPDAAMAHEIAAKPAWPAPYCTPAVDPGAFAAWVDNAEVCGAASAAFTEIIIRGRHDGAPADSPSKGLVFAPDDEAYPTGACIRRLDDVWWEYSTVIDGTSCPSGFRFLAGG